MILLSANGNKKFGIVKAVFVTTNVRLGKSRIFIKDGNFRYKITGYLQNIYQLLYSLAFLLVKTTKIDIHIKKGMNELMILTLQRKCKEMNYFMHLLNVKSNT